MTHDIHKWIFEIPLSDVQTNDKDNTLNDVCLLCGKALKFPPKYCVHLLTSGKLVSTAEPFDESEDQGFHNIGSDCAKRLPNNFTFKI